MSSPPIKPVIIGVAGASLTAAEARLVAAQNPFGLILFRRNCSDVAQVQKLTSDFRALVQRGDAPVLIDEEGGRVARLREPNWREFPAAADYLRAANDPADAAQLAYTAGQLMGAQCLFAGISVDCAPMCDVSAPGNHGGVIGDRAFGDDAATVTRLARAYADGLLAAGVLPVMKHIPGHGRAAADSHEELPVVSASREDLSATDFVPFRELQLPLAMTAHVRYPALDADQPATLSKTIIGDVIRAELGFRGLLVSDAIEMKALRGTLPGLTRQALAAGCDALLYCAGDLEGNRAVLEAAPAMDAEALARWRRAQSFLPVNQAKWDEAAYLLLKSRIDAVTKVENTGDSLVARL